jgi:uncharacterized protein YndB with AHSA1/START domain
MTFPPERVFAEWIDPDALAEWMCPRPARATRIEIDPRVGGALRFEIDDESVEMIVTGRFTALEPPHRLQFTWSCSTWPVPSAESLVTVTLEARTGDETLMTILHAQLPDDLVDKHRDGWELVAQQLEGALRG